MPAGGCAHSTAPPLPSPARRHTPPTTRSWNLCILQPTRRIRTSPSRRHSRSHRRAPPPLDAATRRHPQPSQVSPRRKCFPAAVRRTCGTTSGAPSRPCTSSPVPPSPAALQAGRSLGGPATAIVSTRVRCTRPPVRTAGTGFSYDYGRLGGSSAMDHAVAHGYRVVLNHLVGSALRTLATLTSESHGMTCATRLLSCQRERIEA